MLKRGRGAPYGPGHHEPACRFGRRGRRGDVLVAAASDFEFALRSATSTCTSTRARPRGVPAGTTRARLASRRGSLSRLVTRRGQRIKSSFDCRNDIQEREYAAHFKDLFDDRRSAEHDAERAIKFDGVSPRVHEHTDGRGVDELGRREVDDQVIAVSQGLVECLPKPSAELRSCSPPSTTSAASGRGERTSIDGSWSERRRS